MKKTALVTFLLLLALLPISALPGNAQPSTSDPRSGAPQSSDQPQVEPGQCGDTAAYIHDIQGSGAASPLVGSEQVIEGLVVGDFQDSATQLGGFFVQEEDQQADSNPLTSEGIFVYDDGFGVDVSPGEVVRVVGQVAEFFGLTELNNVTHVELCGPGSVTPAIVTLPVDALSDWERYEGMLVQIEQTLYASDVFTLGRFGEVELSVNGRLDQPTHIAAPGADTLAVQDLNDRSRIQLDDGSTRQNPLPLPPYFGPDRTLRAGATLPGLTGVLSYGYGDYEIQPIGPVTFTHDNPRPPAPRLDSPFLTSVASLNVLNYFTTLDSGAPVCGPSGGLECRGADSTAEFERQRAKLLSALAGLEADIVGLIELENNPGAAIADLVQGLNDQLGAGTYAYIDTGTIGSDAIKVGLIYKPATVSPFGDFAILDASVDPTFLDNYNRPSLAQTFVSVHGERFTVAVNHFKSKGSVCDAVGDPDTGDGQGECNLTRTSAANALVNWLAGDPTASGDADILIIGDLNAYAQEDPLAAIQAAGYHNLIDLFEGPAAFSYVFEGQKGYLDHALASASLRAKVFQAATWHINADEPAGLDYNDYNQPELYQPDEYRASDHDPLLVYLWSAEWEVLYLPLLRR